jgi:hypothetical protein
VVLSHFFLDLAGFLELEALRLVADSISAARLRLCDLLSDGVGVFTPDFRLPVLVPRACFVLTALLAVDFRAAAFALADIFAPDPPFFSPPPVSLLTVAQALRAASFSPSPRSSYPSSMCSAIRFCFSVYLSLLPLAIN